MTMKTGIKIRAEVITIGTEEKNEMIIYLHLFASIEGEILTWQ